MANDVEYRDNAKKFREHWLLSNSSGFDWSGISPAIFGALFESTLNPATRRAGGMVYTSIEKDLHVSTRSTRLNHSVNSVSSVVENITQTAQAMTSCTATKN